MTLEKESEWIDVKKLIQDEKQQRENSDSNHAGNDFQSYKLLNSGSNNSDIESHNRTGISAMLYVKLLNLVARLDKGEQVVVGDMGAGAGFISNQITQQIPTANVYSYDISQDAVEYSLKNFPNVNATQMAISNDSGFSHQFDFIIANEFYPFTRTNSFDLHQGYIDNFLNHLSPGGKLIISLLHTEKCLLNNMKLLRQNYDNFSIQLMPSIKVFRILPNLFLSRLVTKLLGGSGLRKKSYFIIFEN